MTQAFDPYYKWLAIPPSEQPPNHYRLLGVQTFEADLDVIATAADRQMTHVKSFAGGPHASNTQRLLNELAKAKICLLNREQKAIYDAELARSNAQHATENRSTTGACDGLAPVQTNNPPVLPARQKPTVVAPPPSPEDSSSGLAASAMASKGTGRSKFWSPSINLIGHVVAPVVGLTIGYGILCWMGPKYDFLGLMPRDNPNASVDEPIETKPSLLGSEPETLPEVSVSDDEDEVAEAERLQTERAEQERQRQHELAALREEELRRKEEEERRAAEAAERQADEQRARIAMEQRNALRSALAVAAAENNVDRFIETMNEMQSRQILPSVSELAPMLIKMMHTADDPQAKRQLLTWALDMAEAEDELGNAKLAGHLAESALKAARKAQFVDLDRRATLLLIAD
ncbi:MAG: hypothetical protein KDA42_04585 [Planctomycetales bacterium]|nr:hypothetical protein [Planctomycetales bacterium]